MQYGTVEFVQLWDLLFTVGCRPELLGWSDQVFGQQRQRQRQRAENQELRHCQARAQVRAVAPGDQTVFCLTNNSYNSREPSGGRSWSWWRSWRVLVSTVLPFLLYRPDCLARDSPCAGAEYKYQNPVVAALDLQNPRHSHAGRSSQPRPLALSQCSAPGVANYLVSTSTGAFSRAVLR